MVQSPTWEANWFAASQEIPRISRNSKVHYRTHKRPPPVSILGQPNPVHILTSHLLEIHPNIRPSMPRSPQWSLSLRFPHQDPIHPSLLTHMRHMPSPLILLDFITRTILGGEYKSFSSSLCILLHSPVTSSLLGPNILLNTMFSNTLSFLSSRNVSDQVSHPYKTTGKIIQTHTHNENIKARSCNHCCFRKAISITNTHSKYAIYSAFQQQQWLHECVLMFCCTYITCLAKFSSVDC